MKNFLFWEFIYFYIERILERISGGSWTLGSSLKIPGEESQFLFTVKESPFLTWPF